jgi:ribonuclease HI
MEDKIAIFTDGSSRGNPGPGGWGAIVVIKNKVTELGGREDKTTNNRMELTAAIQALCSLGHSMSKSEVLVYTDSSYVINGITKWVYGWQKNNWKSSTKDDVSNRDLWQKLIDVSDGLKIKWNHVEGHAGVPGNERCDEIATSFADNIKINFFKGELSDYEFDLTNKKGGSVKKSKKSTNKGKAYSYVSLVNGKLNVDKTWSECEKRVKGIKGGVKFKKATSQSEEEEIIKDFLK